VICDFETMVFAGDKKEGKWLLANAEGKLREWMLPMVPKWCQTYHLTMTTVLWCALIILFSFFARYDSRWLHLVSFFIFMQYITDLLDGAVGRSRNTGLIKWGYYMDHFLDYLFLFSILIGYSFLVADQYDVMLFFILALFGAFMVNSFLSFAATNEFKIAYMGIGPTEVRLIFIGANTLLAYQTDVLTPALPWVLGLSAFGLFVTVYRTQKMLWELDMKVKAELEAGSEEDD
jgi:phosphatidylglycerophosphate synthase